MEPEIKYIVRTSDPDLLGSSEWLAHWLDRRSGLIKTKIFKGDWGICEGQNVRLCNSKDEVRDRALADIKAAGGIPF
jgi:hypothetical protein